jgi:DNA primase
MKSTVEDLLARINIVDIVSQHVKLRRTGKNLVGLCPFHQEKTPSFTVSIEKQIYYCFGCHEGGNAINFLMKYENLTFQETLENLGRQYGVEVTHRSGEKRSSTLEALSKLADYYHQQLKSSRLAQQYLARRGIDESIIESFKIGFSDRSRQDIKGFLKKAGLPNDILLSTGIVRLKDGEMYDMFRGRIVIPIFDVNERVIGFGGRTIEKDALPKYINSPESPVFSKRTALFGIEKTKKAITEMNEAFIVEGYFDLIALYQHGFRNVIATLGTAITENQLSRLRNYTENITLMLDGDEAGVKSALRLIGVFSDMDIHGNMVVLPSGHDPDSFVRKDGIEGIQKVIADKKSILDYFFDYAKNKYGVDKLEGRISFIRAVMPHIETIQDSIKKRLYIKRLSELTNIEEQHLWDGLRERSDGAVPDEDPSKSIIGQRIIGILLNNPDLIKQCKERGIIDYIKEARTKEVLKKIFHHFEEGKELAVSSFVQAFENDTLRELVLSAVLDAAEYDELENEKIIYDYFRHLERKFIIDESQRITEKMAAAEKMGDEKEMMELLRRKRQVLNLMKSHSAERDDYA